MTKSGQPVIDLDKTHKQPFEFLFIAQKDAQKKIHSVEQDFIISSIPSAIQSHKPPLSDFVSSTILGNGNETSRKMNFLELFGRYLVPNCHTIGNECLKMQQMHYFKKSQ